MSTDTGNGQTHVDGRTARRDRNRVAVLDAVIELFSEGMLSPGVPEVAERSGVSLRSVYRYFEDGDALITSAIERQIDLARPLFRIENEGQGPLEERITGLVATRLRLYDLVRHVYRAARGRAITDPLLYRGLQDSRAFLTRQVARVFAPELEASAAPDHLHTHIDLLTQFDTLEFLLSDRGLSNDEVTAHLTDGLRAALADPARTT